MSTLHDRAIAAQNIPLGLEFGLASCCALVLMTKRKTKGNFPLAITYSGLKLVGICAALANSMTLTQLGRLPFWVGLLINEVVLLILSIRLRDIIVVVPFSRLYSARIKAIRFISELSSALVIVGVVVIVPFVPCACKVETAEFLGVPYPFCDKTDSDTIVRALLRDQLRGIAFALSVTASIAAISSMKFMASSIGREVTGKADRDVIQWMMMDAGWKQSIRTVYGILGLFVNGLFMGTFFYSGTNDCTVVDDDKFRYAMGPVPSALLNAVLAISQVFMADMLLKISAKALEKKLDDNDKPCDIPEESTDLTAKTSIDMLQGHTSEP